MTISLVGVIRKKILIGEFRPGQRMTSERNLAIDFAVNRASVRQALKALVVMGVLTQRPGDGTYITADACAIINTTVAVPLPPNRDSLREVLEMLRMIEPELASRAARHRTASDVEMFKSALGGIEDSLRSTDSVRLVQDSWVFRSLIWKAAGNRVMCELLRNMEGIIKHSIGVSWSLLRQEMLELHKTLVEALGLSDSAAARQAMECLLDVKHPPHAGDAIVWLPQAR